MEPTSEVPRICATDNPQDENATVVDHSLLGNNVQTVQVPVLKHYVIP